MGLLCPGAAQVGDCEVRGGQVWTHLAPSASRGALGKRGVSRVPLASAPTQQTLGWPTVTATAPVHFSGPVRHRKLHAEQEAARAAPGRPQQVCLLLGRSPPSWAPRKAGDKSSYGRPGLKAPGSLRGGRPEIDWGWLQPGRSPPGDKGVTPVGWASRSRSTAAIQGDKRQQRVGPGPG